jgi:hypothetical protein
MRCEAWDRIGRNIVKATPAIPVLRHRIERAGP